MGILDRLLMDEKKSGACRESVYLICIFSPLASIAHKNVSNRVLQLKILELYRGNGLNNNSLVFNWIRFYVNWVIKNNF